MLEGGLPHARVVLVTGGSGTGKSVLVNEFLYQGITRYDEPGVLLTLEEKPTDIFKNVHGFGWDYPSLIRRRRLLVLDMTRQESDTIEIGREYDLSPVIARIEHAIKQAGAKRLVIDGIQTLFSRFKNHAAVRDLFHEMCYRLRRHSVTTLVTTEKIGAREGQAINSVEEFIADGVIELQAEPGQQRILRRLIIRKMRGVSYLSAAVEFQISRNGFEVFPKLAGTRSVAPVETKDRKTFGLPRLDSILGGGIPEGFVAMVSGNTGTGKTTFLMHFVAEAIRQRETAVYVALEEPAGQVTRLAEARGFRFSAWARQGKVALIDVPLIDVRPDELLNDIVTAVRRIKAKRVVIDSISSLFSATMTKEQVRQFLLQLSQFAKSEPTTFLVSYLIGNAFGAEHGQLLGSLSTSDMRLSSAVDGVIVQRYVERGQKVKKLLTVLKLRGSQHDRSIFEYDNGPQGIVMGDKYEV